MQSTIIETIQRRNLRTLYRIKWLWSLVEIVVIFQSADLDIGILRIEFSYIYNEECILYFPGFRKVAGPKINAYLSIYLFYKAKTSQWVTLPSYSRWQNVTNSFRFYWHISLLLNIAKYQFLQLGWIEEEMFFLKCNCISML